MLNLIIAWSTWTFINAKLISRNAMRLEKKPEQKRYKSDTSVCHLNSRAGYHTTTQAFLKSSVSTHPHDQRKTAFSKISSLGSVFEKFHFRWPYSLDRCGREGNPQKEISVFKQKRIRVDGALGWNYNSFMVQRTQWRDTGWGTGQPPGHLQFGVTVWNCQRVEIDLLMCTWYLRQQ